jgi:hypothetical protein
VAKSTSLKRNLDRQLEVYQKANKASQSVRVIIAYN